MIWIGLLIPFCFSSEGSERADEKPWAGFTWPESETSSRLRDGDWSVRFRATEKPKDTVAFCLTCILIYYMIPINFFLQISLLSKNRTARVRDSTPRPVLFLSLSMFCWIYVGIQNVSTPQAKAAFTCQQLSCHKTQASAVVEGLGVQTGLQWIATCGSLSNYANLCLIYTLNHLDLSICIHLPETMSLIC